MDSIEISLFVLGISGREYQASIIKSPHGLGSHRFIVPEDSSLLRDPEAGPGEEQRDLKGRIPRSDSSALLQLREQGEELYRLVFTGENRDPFRKCLDEATVTGGCLRLRLTFQNAPAAADWPWEALLLDSGRFLADLPNVSVERTIGLGRRTGKPPAAADSVLRILFVCASPPDMTTLGIAKEQNPIRAVFGKAKVRIKVKTVASRGELDKATARISWDIVHVICHGDFERNEGGLWLNGENGRVVGRELASFLARRPAALVFLNACHSARSSRDPFAGLAEALLSSGCPAVIAMRRPISDQGAVRLAPEFYEHIAQGETVARALAQWRATSLRDNPDWAVPVLYLADEDFAVWKPRASPPPAREFQPEPPQPDPPSRKWWQWVSLLLVGVPVVAALGYWRYSPADPPPQAPPEVKDDPRCPRIPGLDLPFVYIPAGKFEQGSPKVEAEKPVHPVTLTADFCLGAFELTRGQYAQIVGEPQPAGNDRYYPVEGLTGDEARQLVGTLQARFPEAGFRLPTESEWEYAARAGRPGDEDAPSPANCRGRGDDDPYGGVAAVGSFPPNAWDLYDMKGNVWEWVEDWYAPYGREPAEDPRGPETGDKKVRRGGSYANNAKNCRYSTRAGVQPDREQEAAGLRIVRSPVTVQN